jgi:hypothetical protein
MTSWGLGGIMFVLALVLILALSVFLIVCRRYEDGIVGNIALGLLAIACAIALWDAYAGVLEVPQPVYRLAIMAFALFMARHTWRFAMFHWCGAFGWRRPSDCEAQPSDAR